MQKKICIYMVVRNAMARSELFERVIEKASKITKEFFIVDHGSADDSVQYISDLWRKFQIHIDIQQEKYLGTMDEMKWKYYHILREKYKGAWKYIFILDWDEVCSDALIKEINSLDFTNDVYLINRHTFLLTSPIDRNSFLPLLFEVSSVEVGAFQEFHDLYRIKSKKIKKLRSILLHYSYENIQSFFQKNLFYAAWEAKALFKCNPNFSTFLISLRCLWEWLQYFIYTLVYHYNFLTFDGWFYSFNWFVYKFYKYLFYRELQLWQKK